MPNDERMTNPNDEWPGFGLRHSVLPSFGPEIRSIKSLPRRGLRSQPRVAACGYPGSGLGTDYNPERVGQKLRTSWAFLCNPFRVEVFEARYPRAAFPLALGCVIQPLRGKEFMITPH